MAMISMRVDVWCPDCRRRAPRPACPRCGGHGVVDELFSAWLAVRPGTKDGDVLAPSAELPGTVDPVRFRVQVGAAG